MMAVRSFIIPILLFCALGASAAIDPETAPASITGTYNVTFALVAVPSDVAYSLVPEGYTILPPSSEQFPGIGDGKLPIFIELGREANAGPPLLNIENFQEAKVEVPNVLRVEDSEAPFLYKRWIAVDDAIDVFGSWIQFGLNTSKEEFNPSNSSDATSFDYSIVGAVDGTFTPTEGEPQWPLSTFESVGGQPWFAEYPTCAQHFYEDSSVPVTYLTGSVTLYPPYAGANATEPVTFVAQAIHGIFDFKIVGPLICDYFV